MKYSALLKVYDKDFERIYSCFKPELIKKKRADLRLKKEKGYVLFEIESDDSVALRAVLNSITKLLTVYENVDKIEYQN